MNLFQYTDYRQYLRDFYLRQKSLSTAYSFRVFASRAKLASPNYLKLVIDGKRRITDRTLPCFARGLGLSKQEARYFRTLVLYQESDDPEAKAMHLQEMLRTQRREACEARQISEDRTEILRRWHHWAIREMVLLEDFRPDPEWIAARLKRRITSREATASLELLQRLEFIRQENGKWIQSEPLITTSDGISSLLLKSLHVQFFELAIHSIMNDPVESRVNNAVTLALPKAKLPELQKRIRNFRKEINRDFSQTQGNDDVYHFTVNLFPLTKKGGNA